MSTQLSDPSVVMNNDAVYIMPNTFSYKEGFGEQTVKNQSAGNGVFDQLYSDNAETKIGGFKFSIAATVANIALARQWKANGNLNATTVTETASDGTLTRNFSGVALTNDYDVNLQTDGVLELEFMSNRPTI